LTIHANLRTAHRYSRCILRIAAAAFNLLCLFCKLRNPQGESRWHFFPGYHSWG
jgi:hypothetical protein